MIAWPIGHIILIAYGALIDKKRRIRMLEMKLYIV